LRRSSVSTYICSNELEVKISVSFHLPVPDLTLPAHANRAVSTFSGDNCGLFSLSHTRSLSPFAGCSAHTLSQSAENRHGARTNILVGFPPSPHLSLAVAYGLSGEVVLSLCFKVRFNFSNLFLPLRSTERLRVGIWHFILVFTLYDFISVCVLYYGTHVFFVIHHVVRVPPFIFCL